MIRKAIIILLTVGAVGSSLLWVVVPPIARQRIYSRYGFGGLSRCGGDPRVVGLMAIGDSYLVDLQVADSLRFGTGIDEGAFVMVVSTPVSNAGRAASFELAQGRFRIWRDIVENPSICGIPQAVSLGLGGVYTPTFRLVHGLRVPCWATIVLFATYPAVAFLRGPRLRRRRRPTRGLCFKCGYDLTGNESGICPECGTKIDHEAREGDTSA